MLVPKMAAFLKDKIFSEYFIDDYDPSLDDAVPIKKRTKNKKNDDISTVYENFLSSWDRNYGNENHLK